MCRVDWDSAPDFYTEKMVTARKAHTCSECRRTIHRGERYERVAGKWHGLMSSYTTCVHCIAARDWLHIACGGWIFTEVLDELVEHWHESPTFQTMTLGRLIAGMRRKWSDGKAEIPDADVIRASIPERARAY